MDIRECKECKGDGEINWGCPECSGSGEGMADGTTCQRCKGQGGGSYKCEECDGEGSTDFDEPSKYINCVMCKRQELKCVSLKVYGDDKSWYCAKCAAELRRVI